MKFEWEDHCMLDTYSVMHHDLEIQPEEIREVLEGVRGVECIYLERYRVQVVRGRVFDWKPVKDDIVQALIDLENKVTSLSE